MVCYLEGPITMGQSAMTSSVGSMSLVATAKRPRSGLNPILEPSLVNLQKIMNHFSEPKLSASFDPEQNILLNVECFYLHENCC
jgi:hypothetical protein